jgi:hypothetical protein
MNLALIKRSLPCILALLFLPNRGQSQGVTRSGGVIGSGGGGFLAEEKPDDIRRTAHDPIVIRAQNLSRQQAASIFSEQVSCMYAKTDTNSIVQTHRWRYVGDGRWERESVDGATIRLLQHIDGCRYRAELLRWHAWKDDFVPADTDAFAVDLYMADKDKTGFRPMAVADSQKALMADGQRIVLARLSDTGQTFSYTTVMGAKSTVRLMLGWLDSMPISYDDFCRALSRGQAFDVLQERSVQCHACRGKGTRPKTYEERGRIGTPMCQTCRGKKVLKTRVLHRITP